MALALDPPLLGGLDLACRMTAAWPLPGQGATLERWRALAEVAMRDVVLARLVEAHADADAILAELEDRRAPIGSRYGVWAAKAPGHGLVLDESGRVNGSVAWCSGATLLTHALVIAEHQGRSALVEVELDHVGVRPADASWAAAGMRGSDTRSVVFNDVPATLLKGDYLERPGFWMGAIGVAACWYGGTVPLASPITARVTDPHAAAHLGAISARLGAARAFLRDAARLADEGLVTQRLALQVRATVADTATEVARRVGRALGPGPWAQDARHAQRLADLEVYVRQDHAERDLAVLGRSAAHEGWAL